MDDNNKSLELEDIHDASFCALEDIPVRFTKRGGRVYFIVPANEHTFRILARIRENPPIPILDFIRHLKRMRAMMLDYRDGGNGERSNGYEKRAHL